MSQDQLCCDSGGVIGVRELTLPLCGQVRQKFVKNNAMNTLQMCL